VSDLVARLRDLRSQRERDDEWHHEVDYEMDRAADALEAAEARAGSSVLVTRLRERVRYSGDSTARIVCREAADALAEALEGRRLSEEAAVRDLNAALARGDYWKSAAEASNRTVEWLKSDRAVECVDGCQRKRSE